MSQINVTFHRQVIPQCLGAHIDCKHIEVKQSLANSTILIQGSISTLRHSSVDVAYVTEVMIS